MFLTGGVILKRRLLSMRSLLYAMEEVSEECKVLGNVKAIVGVVNEAK